MADPLLFFPIPIHGVHGNHVGTDAINVYLEFQYRLKFIRKGKLEYQLDTINLPAHVKKSAHDR